MFLQGMFLLHFSNNSNEYITADLLEDVYILLFSAERFPLFANVVEFFRIFFSGVMYIALTMEQTKEEFQWSCIQMSLSYHSGFLRFYF